MSNKVEEENNSIERQNTEWVDEVQQILRDKRDEMGPHGCPDEVAVMTSMIDDLSDLGHNLVVREQGDFSEYVDFAQYHYTNADRLSKDNPE